MHLDALRRLTCVLLDAGVTLAVTSQEVAELFVLLTLDFFNRLLVVVIVERQQVVARFLV